MTGIYKITSPKNKVYIGQGLDIKKRFRAYKRMDCKGQTRLFASLKKYGVEKHKFEIITTCEENELNELERYYQEIYNCIGIKGLNCQYTKTETQKYRHSEETKKKIGNSHKGRKGRTYIMSDEHKRKIGLANKGNKRPDFSKIVSDRNKKSVGEKNHFYGKNHTEETKLKISKTKKLKI